MAQDLLTSGKSEVRDRVLDCLYTFVVGSPGKTLWRNWNSPSRVGKMYYKSYKKVVLFNSMTNKITCAVCRYTLFVCCNQPFINYKVYKREFSVNETTKRAFSCYSEVP